MAVSAPTGRTEWDRQLGILLTAMAGTCMPALGMVQVVCKRSSLPYFALVGSASGIVGFASLLVATSTVSCAQVERRRWKWIIMRGVFGTFNFGCSQMAVGAGTSLGDVAVLQSISIISAGFLGTAFDKGSVCWLHWVALLLGAGSCALIIQADAEDVPKLGHTIALCSGVFSGAMLISVRMLQGVDDLLLCGFVSFHHMLNFWSLYWSGLFDEVPLFKVQENQAGATLVCTVLTFLILTSIVALCKGGKLYHVGGSSTVYMASNMSAGFVGQIYLSGRWPNAITFLGASLMLMAVGMISMARAVYAKAEEPDFRNLESSADKECPAEAQRTESVRTTPRIPSNVGHASQEISSVAAEADCSTVANSTTAADDDAVSLASFIASELSGLSVHSVNTGTRQRKPVPTSLAGPPAAMTGSSGGSWLFNGRVNT